MTTPPLPYRLFDAALARRERLSPHMSRLTFASEDVRGMATHAADQRIKIFFPDAEGRAADLPRTADWLGVYKQQDPARRSPMRTYTIRALRPEAGEVDVDFVLHGETGPASTWALNAGVGDAVQIVAPDASYPGEGGGFEWKPPVGLKRLLLMADETGLPAAAGILEQLVELAEPPQTQVFLEMPTDCDRIPLPDWPGLTVEWLPRDGGDHPAPGSLLVEAAGRAVPTGQANGATLEEVDIDQEILWDRAVGGSNDFYAWIAAEAGAVRAIRTLMIKERGIDRGAVNLMGYWRVGVALDER